jgi:hypothetical protein
MVFELVDLVEHTRCNIPAGREDQDIGERGIKVAGFGSKDAENRWIDVVNGDGADIDEFCQVVFVWDLQ